MIEPTYQPIEWRDGKVRWIDQTLLPTELCYRQSDRVEEIEAAIKTLAIRGAPLIGIAALYAAALALRPWSNLHCKELTSDQLGRIRQIAQVRPTAVNLMNAIDRLLIKIAAHSDENAFEIALQEAIALHRYEIEACWSIARNGADLLPSNGTVLTHCNTGPLATGGIGTALGIILYAVKEQGKALQVFATETGPLRQGARLTVWELQQWGIPVTLIPDTAAASLIRTTRLDAIVVGADRVTVNGDFANKIGTCGLAGMAKHAGVKFYTAFPWSTIDPEMANGNLIPIELRHSTEVLQATRFPELQQPAVWNPAFDVTPNDWVTGYITDRGYFEHDRFTTVSIR